MSDAFLRSGPGILDGIVVADFSRVLAGPYCTMLLGDMGATIIKIESPTGDETRTWRPPVHEGESTYYLSINRNKRSIVLDLADPDDCETGQRIAAKADVVIENLKPGGAARFGLDYDSVRATNPAVVHASITGFGAASGATLPGYDLLVQAASGLMDLTGDPDGPPYRAGVAVADVVTGLHAAIGIVGALFHRARTGKGQRVEVSLLASALSALVNQSGGYVIGGATPHRMGNAHPSIYPYEPLPTADGDLVVAAANDGQFARLCAVLGRPDLPADPRFATNPDRSAHRTDLRPLLVDALAGRSASEWHQLLTAAGVPCSPILDVAGGVALATALGLAPALDGVLGIRHPVTYSATPATYDGPAPGLGADGDAVRRWLEDA